MLVVSGCRIVSGSDPLVTVFETPRNSIIAWARPSKHGLERCPHVGGDDPRTLDGRMNAVALVQCIDAGDALEQKRHEWNVVLARELRIDLMKRDDVALAEVRRRFHSGEDDGDVLRLGPLDDRRKIRLEFGGWKTAKAVVSAERDDENAHVSGERPVKPAEAARGRIARYARVHDGKPEACGVDPLLQQRGIRLVRVETQAGRQAVAEHDHARPIVHRGKPPAPEMPAL